MSERGPVDVSSGVAAQPVAETKARIWTMDFVLADLDNFFFYVAYYMFLPTLPLYLASMGMAKSEVGLVVGIYTLSTALTRPIFGAMADRGRSKAALIGGTACMMAVAVLLNFARGLPAFLALRLLHGVGFAAFSTPLGTLVAKITPVSRRAEAIGYFTLFVSMGNALGPLLGTVLMESGGFGRVSAGVVGIGAFSVLFSALLSKRSVMPVGTVSHKLVLFSRSAVQPSIVSLASGFSWGGMISFLALFVDERHLGSAGTFFTLYAVTLFVCRLASGRLADRYGLSRAIYVGMVTTGLALLLMAFVGSEATLLAVAVLAGLGVGMERPATMALAANRAPEAERGQAMAAASMGYDIGVALGGAALGPVAEFAGFGAVFVTAAAFLFAGLVIFAALRRKERREEVSPTSAR